MEGICIQLITSLFKEGAFQVTQWERIYLSTQEIQEIWVWSLGREDPLEKEMATHSTILDWKIAWAEELDGLQSMGLQRFGQDWTCMHTTPMNLEFHSSVEAGKGMSGRQFECLTILLMWKINNNNDILDISAPLAIIIFLSTRKSVSRYCKE